MFVNKVEHRTNKKYNHERENIDISEYSLIKTKSLNFD